MTTRMVVVCITLVNVGLLPSLQVTSFIREQSRENLQIIVISLKEEFYSKSDALLGVYSEVQFHYIHPVGHSVYPSPSLYNSLCLDCYLFPKLRDKVSDDNFHLFFSVLPLPLSLSLTTACSAAC